MQVIGLGLLFALGMLVGIVLDVVLIFWWSLFKGARAVHGSGVMVRAELRALDELVGPRLAGPALVRLGGAFRADEDGADVLGMAVRLRGRGDAGSNRQGSLHGAPDSFVAGPAPASFDATVGDQDFLLGTFESFATARASMATTRVDDFLANQYASVAPWQIAGLGVGHLRAMPPPPGDRGRGADRLARLDADLAAGRAVFTLEVRGAGAPRPVAELHLLERLAVDGKALRISMFRAGRGLRPVGFRNGIRATVYPISQLARRLRGG